MAQTSHFTDDTANGSSTVQTVSDAFTVYVEGTLGDAKIQMQLSPVGAARPQNVDVLSGAGVYAYPPMYGDLNFEIIGASATTEVSVTVEN